MHGGGGARFFPTGANLVQRWVRAIFVHRLVGARKQENGVGNHFFGAGNPFFGAGNQFFGENLVLEIHFLGFGNLDEISGRFS